MDWLTQYINIYYMLIFMSACYFIFNRTKILVKTSISTPIWTLIIGAITGIIYHTLLDSSATPKILVTTFTCGTSFYEIALKWILKKLGLQKD